MMSVLLLTFTVSIGFVSNGYQKAYAAAASDLGTKIREWINNQLREDLFVPSSSIAVLSIKITLSGFPHQTGESVTNVGCSATMNRNVCTGADNIVIPGIGEGRVSVFLHEVPVAGVPSVLILVHTSLNDLPGQTAVSSGNFLFNGGVGIVSDRINIPGIGTGQETVQLT